MGEDDYGGEIYGNDESIKNKASNDNEDFFVTDSLMTNENVEDIVEQEKTSHFWGVRNNLNDKVMPGVLAASKETRKMLDPLWMRA